MGYDPTARVSVVFGKDSDRTGTVMEQRHGTLWHLVQLDGDDKPTWIHYFHLKEITQQEEKAK